MSFEGGRGGKEREGSAVYIASQVGKIGEKRWEKKWADGNSGGSGRGDAGELSCLHYLGRKIFPDALNHKRHISAASVHTNTSSDVDEPSGGPSLANVSPMTTQEFVGDSIHSSRRIVNEVSDDTVMRRSGEQ